jgi:ABC-type oligopeptide transport system substrate-binding subunit
MIRLVAVVLLCAPALAAAAPTVLRIGNGPEVESLDPHRARSLSAANVLRDLYEGLTSEEPNGDVATGAADSWEISADGREYLFHLRADALWSNGDPVTAEDFVAGLRRSVDPATGSQYSQMLAPIENAEAISSGKLPPDQLGVAVVDARTLRLRLKSPTPYFLGVLSHSSTYPIHRPSLARHGERFARAGNLVGNGAYRLSEWVVHGHLALERNRRYWNDAATSVDRIVYYPTEDLASEFKRYRAGELDITNAVPGAQVPWIRRHIPHEYRVAPALGLYFYGLNLTRPPLQDQPKLRTALSLALDREVIAHKVLGSGERPAYSWVPPGAAGFAPQRPAWADWPKAQRLAEAQRLYAEAGYSGRKPLQLEIRYNTYDDHKKIATVIAAMWKQSLGAQITLVNEEWQVFAQNRRARKLTQVFRASWFSDYLDAFSFLDILRSGHGLNDSGYSNPAYDALLERIASEGDNAQRLALMAQAERTMLEDQPVLPIYFYVSKHLVKPWVSGWQDNVMDHHYVKDLKIAPHR